MSIPTSKPARALIVDDSSSLRQVLAAYLTAEGIEVIGQFAHGKGLLNTIKDRSPEIICLDYNLPDCNGIDLLKAIIAEYPSIAVVMITGDTDPKLHSAAAEAGAAGFIHKPFSQDQISKEFTQIIQTQRFLIEVKKSAEPAKLNSSSDSVKPKAIVVDDSKTIRALLIAILLQNEIEVIGEATNGMQAVTLAQELQPDIMFLDIFMPVMGGMEALKQIRSASPKTRIVMITALVSRELVVEAIQQGAAGFIVKPLVASKVTETIAKVRGNPG
jgi:two-component system chemotaxis response regulator CheY